MITQNGLDNKIAELINSYSSKIGEIHLEDDLYKDCGIYGDDADEFFEQFANLFNVDMSNFDINEYFPGEGNSSILNVVLWFLGKYKKLKHKPITVGDLVNGIDNGYL